MTEARIRKQQERERDKQRGWKHMSLRLPQSAVREFQVLAAQRRAEALLQEREEELARQVLPE